MPIYNWNMSPYSSDEYRREYYSTLNFRRTVNGTSGFSPKPWQEFVTDLLATFPSEESILKLKKIGVNLIIVHKAEYGNLYKNDYEISGKKMLNGGRVIEYLLSSKDVYLEKQFEEDYVFRIK